MSFSFAIETEKLLLYSSGQIEINISSSGRIVVVVVFVIIVECLVSKKLSDNPSFDLRCATAFLGRHLMS